MFRFDKQPTRHSPHTDRARKLRMESCERRVLLAGDLSTGLIDLFATDNGATIAVGSANYSDYLSNRFSPLTPTVIDAHTLNDAGLPAGVNLDVFVLSELFRNDVTLEQLINSYNRGASDSDDLLQEFLPESPIRPFEIKIVRSEPATSVAVVSEVDSRLISLQSVLDTTDPWHGVPANPGPLAPSATAIAANFDTSRALPPSHSLMIEDASNVWGELARGETERSTWDRMWAMDVPHLPLDDSSASSHDSLRSTDAADSNVTREPSTLEQVRSQTNRLSANGSTGDAAADGSRTHARPAEDYRLDILIDPRHVASRDAAFAQSHDLPDAGGGDWQGMLDRRNGVAAGVVAALVAGKAWRNGMSTQRTNGKETPTAPTPRGD